jgi:hypothetical protein
VNATNALSLAPGFSRVFRVVPKENRFNGFPPNLLSQPAKPLKRFGLLPPLFTRLKPGANERPFR